MDFVSPGLHKPLQLNMTPMIDIVFLLIIFFMTVAEFARLETESVHLPVADQAKIEDTTPVGRLLINLRENGDIVIAKRAYDHRGFLELLKSEAERYRSASGAVRVAVLIRADGEAQFGGVQRIMLSCARAGIWQVSVAANKEEVPFGN